MRIPIKLCNLLNALDAHGCGPVRRAGDEWRCRCPAHNDRGPSLYIGIAEGAILVRCSAGCATEAVCAAIDIAIADLFYGASEEWEDDSTPTAETALVLPESTADTTADRHWAYSALLTDHELSAPLRRAARAACPPTRSRAGSTAPPTAARC